jgi:hypothetical protein
MNASGAECRSDPEGEAGPGGLARDGGGDDGPGPLVEHVVTEDQNGPFAGLFVVAGRVELGPEQEIAILALLIASQWYCQGSHRRFLPSRLAVGEAVEGAADAAAAGLVEDVGVDHGGLDVAVAQQLLDGADVVPLLEEVGGERVPEGVAAGGLGQPGLRDRLLHRLLHGRLVQMVAADGAGARIAAGRSTPQALPPWVDMPSHP